MHSKMMFAVLAAWAYCQLVLYLLLSSMARSLSAELLSSHLSSSLYLHPALFQPRCRTHHFPLLNSMLLLIIQCSNLSRSLCKTSCACMESKVPPGLVSYAKFLRMHSTPVSRSLIKMSNKTGPRIKTWRTSLMTVREIISSQYIGFLWWNDCSSGEGKSNWSTKN